MAPKVALVFRRDWKRIKMSNPKVTRGYGLLEGFLAKRRAKVAGGLIPPSSGNGRILDIGCGTYPLFLINTDFCEKHGLDKVAAIEEQKGLEQEGLFITNYDIETEQILSYESEYFDVVTMLAVFEHIEPTRVVEVLREIYRVLKPGGMYIMTTPAPWTDRMLWLMARLHLVSPVEIQEHKDSYCSSKISEMLQEANFSKDKLRFGYFEMYMNIWATATK